ncbi:MAG: TonB-dependent receptor [Bacteroidales bacterium]
MQKLYLLLFFVMLQGMNVFAQKKVTISGYIRDAETGEEIIGATLFVSAIKDGAISNTYGYYAISLSPISDSFNIKVNCMGYASQTLNFAGLTSDTVLNVKLALESTMIDEVVVTAEEKRNRQVSTGMLKLDLAQIKSLPTTIGEPDIIKNIQKQPGVVSIGEGTSSYFVRGGSADQNQITIDEANVYDPSHLFGLFSVFNSDVIKSVDLYKGGISSKYGGRLSSFLDIHSIDGNNKEFHGSGSVGLLLAKLMIEAPIKKDKSSFMISGRRSYIDLFQRMSSNPEVSENLISFYDLNAKVNWKLSDRDRLYLAGYFGRDNYKLGDDIANFGWGNATGTFRWNHLFNEKLFANTTLLYSQFQYQLDLDVNNAAFKWTSLANEAQAKIDFDWFHTNKSRFQFGYSFSYNTFLPAKIDPRGDNTAVSSFKIDRLYSMENTLYINHNLKIGDNLSLQYGLRYSNYASIGPYNQRVYEDPQDNINPQYTIEEYGKFEIIKAFNLLAPRASLSYMFADDFSVKASYDRTYQNLHLIANGALPLPFNTWQPSTQYVDPQEADQFALGFFKDYGYNYSLSLGAFYKNFNNITAFADNSEVFFNEDIITEIRSGEGKAYGLEFSAQKNKGKLQGELSYTLSKATQQIEGVNNDREFAASHDRRHVVNISATYKLDERWTFGASWQYGTGRPFTMPTGRYEFDDQVMYYYSDRNAYRLPDFHRLDMSVTFIPNPRRSRSYQGSWVVSVVNVYNRKNAFTIFMDEQESDGVYTGKTEPTMMYLFPFLPTISYNFKF